MRPFADGLGQRCSPIIEFAGRVRRATRVRDGGARLQAKARGKIVAEVETFHEFERRGWSAESVVLGYHDSFSGITTQAVAPLLDAAAAKPGGKVLDVACGAGYAAAAAAERGCSATGVDFSPTQVALAARLHPTLVFCEGDASALPFGADEFDAVVSNFGIPHFPDPQAFLREAFRVLRRGGRVAVSAWTNPDPRLGFGVLYAAVQKHGRVDVPIPTGPNFFPFGDTAQCERALLEAGFTPIAITTPPVIYRMATPETFLDAAMKGTVRGAALLAAQRPEALAAIRGAMREAIGGYARDGAFELPMPTIVAAGEKL